MLRLHDPTGDPAVQSQVEGILDVASRPLLRRRPDGAFARGLEIALRLDPAAFAGSSPFLFGRVLQAFYGALAPPNAFVEVRLDAGEPWET
jgi:type VI secretion system protein ImpG